MPTKRSPLPWAPPPYRPGFDPALGYLLLLLASIPRVRFQTADPGTQSRHRRPRHLCYLVPKK